MPIPGLGSPMPPMGGAGGPPAPGGVGPVTKPGPMAGGQAQGITGVKVGLEALQKALPQLQMGSEIHTAVLKAIADIGKQLDKAGGGNDPAAIIQQLMQLARNAKTNPNAMAALPPGGGGGSPAPTMPPMMPPMGGEG